MRRVLSLQFNTFLCTKTTCSTPAICKGRSSEGGGGCWIPRLTKTPRPRACPPASSIPYPAQHPQTPRPPVPHPEPVHQPQPQSLAPRPLSFPDRPSDLERPPLSAGPNPNPRTCTTSTYTHMHTHWLHHLSPPPDPPPFQSPPPWGPPAPLGTPPHPPCAAAAGPPRATCSSAPPRAPPRLRCGTRAGPRCPGRRGSAGRWGSASHRPRGRGGVSVKGAGGSSLLPPAGLWSHLQEQSPV